MPADDAPTQAALKHGAVYKYFRMTAAHQEVNAGAVIEKLDLSILYVEDELVTRRMVNGILQRRFSTVYQAQDGREGLELFQAYNPDVVITDSKMPAMDGIEMSRIIKSLKPETPIIFTSAYEEPEFMEKLDQIGVQRKFVKPIELKELLKALENIHKGKESATYR